MRNFLIRATLASALGLAIASLSGCGGAAESKEVAKTPETPAVPVEVGSVTSGTLEPSYAATAPLEAEREATIRAEVMGEVLAVLVEEGDRVQAGQVLARLDAARSSLELKQVQSVAARLKHESARGEQLLDRRMISREAYDRTRSDREVQAAVVDLARLSVDKSVIRAPYAGTITRRHIKQGQWMTLQAPTFDIADFSELKARLDVPERQSQLIQPGQKVALAADALPGQGFQGTVERVSPIVDRASGTVGVTVAVDNDGQALRPGLFTRLGIAYQHIAEATLMPKTAVVTDGSLAHVFVVEQNVAHKRDVKLGLENGTEVQVVEGLLPGATVVTVGQGALKDGDKVEVVNVTRTDESAVAAK